MMEYFTAAAIGFGIATIIFTIFDKWNHGQWIKLCDRYEAMIEKLLAERDDADRWKQN